MNTSEIDRLLDPAPMPLEMGYERLANGVLHVACRTDLHGCTGEMFEWWFRFRPNTQQYTWWHPLDHISSEWLEAQEGTHIGAIHKVEERFGAGPPVQLLIQVREPGEFFSADALASARANHAVSGMVCGRGGESWQAPRDPAGRVMGTRLFHICRDTEWGSVLRSHFFLGWDLPSIGKSPDQIAQMIPDPVAPALLGHCYNEFSFLSRFLPSLFSAENRATHKVQLPW
jgi:DAPG hydrolase PhiG domain